MVLKGVADTAFFDPGYSPAKIPNYGLFELPLLARIRLEASIAMWRVYNEGHVSGYDKVKFLGTYSTDVYFINTKAPIKSFYKLGGLKLRAAGPVQSDTVKALGGVPIGLPISQTTEALSHRLAPGTRGHPDVPADGGIRRRRRSVGQSLQPSLRARRPLAGRAGHDFKASLERVVRFGQSERGFAAAKERREQTSEVTINDIKGFQEAFTAFLV